MAMLEIALVAGLLLMLLLLPFRRSPKFRLDILIPERQPERIIDSAHLVRHLSNNAKGK